MQSLAHKREPVAPRPLLQLTPALASAVRSQTVITTVAQCLAELIDNSLDAGALTIHASVDLAAWAVTVSDDGQGIREADMRLLAKRHHTSKIGSLRELEAGPSTRGYRGEALAAIAALASLEITSKERHAAETWCKVLRSGIEVSCGPAVRPLAQSGTVVSVHDLLHSAPVRRAACRVTFMDVRACVLRFAMAHPRVSFMLRDGATASGLMPPPAPLLHVAAGTSLAALAGLLLGPAAAATLRPVTHAAGAFQFRGLLSCPPAGVPAGSAAAAGQLLAVNGRWCPVRGPVHRLLDTLFRRVALQSAGHAPENGAPSPTALAALPRLRQLRPCYVLLLECPPTACDASLQPDKAPSRWDRQSLADLLAATTALAAGAWAAAAPRWLLSSLLTPAPPAAPAASPPPTSTRPAEAARGWSSPVDSPRASWLHNDSGSDGDDLGGEMPHSPTPPHQTLAKRPRLSRPVDVLASVAASLPGFYPASRPQRPTTSPPAPLPMSPGSPSKWGTTAGGGRVAARVSTWRNPVMQAGSPGALPAGMHAPALATPHEVTRAQLDAPRTRCLGQVDAKFVLIACGGPGAPLALLDQHAAHERVRLEAMRAALLPRGPGDQPRVPTVSLAPAVDVPLSPLEWAALSQHAARVSDWGWRWAPSDIPAACSVALISCPSVAGVLLGHADFCEYLRELASGAGGGLPPPSLLRLMASKACRGAVMFGDVLTRGQCDALLADLQATAMAFQCAHGRPTTAPLISLDAVHAHLARRAASLADARLRPSVERFRAALASARAL